MDIKPASNFRDCRDIPARVGSLDPRAVSFAEKRIVIDLRECEFVRPAAVMWCAVYALLAFHRGCHIELLVPTNAGVSIYLASIGLFALLKRDGIVVDDRQV